MPVVSSAVGAAAAGGKQTISKSSTECVNVRSSNHTTEFLSYTTLKKLPSANEWKHAGNMHKKVPVDVYLGRPSLGHPHRFWPLEVERDHTK